MGAFIVLLPAETVDDGIVGVDKLLIDLVHVNGWTVAITRSGVDDLLIVGAVSDIVSLLVADVQNRLIFSCAD